VVFPLHDRPEKHASKRFESSDIRTENKELNMIGARRPKAAVDFRDTVLENLL